MVVLVRSVAYQLLLALAHCGKFASNAAKSSFTVFHLSQLFNEIFLISPVVSSFGGPMLQLALHEEAH
jgi:hypothetical protein